MFKNQLLKTLIVGALILSTKVNGQTEPQKKIKKVFYSIGATTAMFPEYEGSDNFKIFPLPNFSANWINGKYIRVNGINTEVNLNASRKWNFGPLLQARVNRNSSASNSKIALLPKLNLAFGAGLFVKYIYKKMDFRAAYSHDITGVNDGSLATFETGYTHRTKKIMTRTAISTSFGSSNFLNTYFGIDAQSSQLSTLAAYELESGFKDLGLSSNLVYFLNNKWMIGTAIRYTYLIGDVAKSPIVKEGSRNQVVTALFTSYRF